jgi:hypothetical protein
MDHSGTRKRERSFQDGETTEVDMHSQTKSHLRKRQNLNSTQVFDEENDSTRTEDFTSPTNDDSVKIVMSPDSERSRHCITEYNSMNFCASILY